MENYYELLEVKNFADIEVIKAAYKALSKKYHPDLNKNIDPIMMIKINNAYETLSNRQKKEIYDIQLKRYLDLKTTKLNENHQKHENEKNNNRHFYNTTKLLKSIISIISIIFVGTITSYVIIGILSANGSWSYIIYTLYGYFIGKIAYKISNNNSDIFIAITVLIVIISMVLPIYDYLSDVLPLYYNSSSNIELMIKATIETVKFFLANGIIRFVFIVLTPFSVISAFED